MSQGKNYTASDIERYHRGQLSPAEMHAMEKAALDDPFLADALEGYVHTSTAAADLSTLQQKLQIRIEADKKRKPLFYIGNNWMKIAALFILFAGAGWLIFQTFSGTDKNNMAVGTHTDKLTRQQAPVATSVTKDSTTNLTTALQNKRDTTIAEKEIFPSSNDVAALKRTAPSPNAPALRRQAFAKTEAEANFEKETLMQEKDQADRTPVAAASSLGKEMDRKPADTLRNMNVVMKPTEVAPDEMVVMKNKSESPAAKRRMQVVVDTLEPAEGWTNFDDYIASNLRMPDEMKSKPVKGEVELSFDVNQEGEPVNITVVRSLCDKCDEEAVRLLKAGPKWKINNKKKGKVKIRF